MDVDPVSALRALDGIRPVPPNSLERDTYADILALRVVANSMLGLNDVALASARDLATYAGRAPTPLRLVTWLLNFSGDADATARLLIKSGCGDAACTHPPVIELAIQTVELNELSARADIARQIAVLRPECRDLAQLATETRTDEVLP